MSQMHPTEYALITNKKQSTCSAISEPERQTRLPWFQVLILTWVDSICNQQPNIKVHEANKDEGNCWAKNNSTRKLPIQVRHQPRQQITAMPDVSNLTMSVLSTGVPQTVTKWNNHHWSVNICRRRKFLDVNAMWLHMAFAAGVWKTWLTVEVTSLTHHSYTTEDQYLNIIIPHILTLFRK